MILHERSQERAVHRHGALPGGSLDGVEIEAQRHQLERREVPPSEVSDGELEHGGADELRDPLCCRSIRRRRGQPQSLGSGTEIESLVPDTAAEVVYLVDDQQVEPVAEPVHLAPPALERRDRDRLDAALTVAETTNRAAEGGGDLAYPLREKDARWHQREGGAPRAGHRGDCDARLAGTRRKHDDPTPARGLPGPERGILVRAQVRFRPRPRHVRSAVHLVREVDATPREFLSNRGVVPRRCAESANARIPQSTWEIGEI
ncbi:MAG TPA: hypothetical protein VFL83_07725 [Anaeromyxobacter sp.]|nr:hypothetical protein [Anaeromyxobacter sp.]